MHALSIVNMNYLQVQPEVIHLQGISRSCSFRIINRNDFLAVSFSLEVPHGATGLLRVFPDQGILLGGEEQKVRAKLAGEEGSGCEGREVDYSVLVKFTYNSQYNKRCLVKNSMGGWDQLAKDVFQKQVRIVSGGEREAIENYIREQIVFEKKFGTDALDLSAIKLHQGRDAENESALDLDISSRTGDKQSSFLERGSKSKLNTSLQVDRIVPLDFGESRTKQEGPGKRAGQKGEGRDQIVESRLIPQDLSKSFSISMRTAQKNNFSEDGTTFNNSSDNNSKQKTLDLIILAIISAFFVALGSNIKRILS